MQKVYVSKQKPLKRRVIHNDSKPQFYQFCMLIKRMSDESALIGDNCTLPLPYY